MKELEVSLQTFLTNKELRLFFKGLKTGDYLCPSSASNLFLNINSEGQHNEGYTLLKHVIHKIIEGFVRRGLVSKNDLAFSHISLDLSSGMYINKMLNVPLI
jgi:phosphoribosylaminoimidazole (AIR) synthetase